MQVVVARQQPDGMLVYGVYLIDQYLLGLKNTLYEANVPVETYRRDVLSYVNTTHRSNPARRNWRTSLSTKR